MTDAKQQPGRVWSTAPPGARPGSKRVEIAGRAAPINTGVTRRQHMGTLLRSRAFVWAFAILGGGGFLAMAAMTKDYRAAALVPLGVAVVLPAWAWYRASELSERDFFIGFAQTHGFTYTPQIVLMETTPLLGAGDRRHCEHYMEGPIDSELSGYHAGLAHYIYETVEERTDPRDRVVKVYTPHYFTICVIDLQRVITSFPGVFLTERGGLFGGDSWMQIDHLQKVELESSTLSNKYKLLTRPEQNRALLLQLFQPSFQVWLSELPFQVYFEFSGGTLCVYVPKQLDDTTSLDILLQTTARIAKRFLKEGEPLKPVPATAVPGGLTSGPPPANVRQFPAPPAATKPPVPAPAPIPPTQSTPPPTGAV